MERLCLGGNAECSVGVGVHVTAPLPAETEGWTIFTQSTIGRYIDTDVALLHSSYLMIYLQETMPSSSSYLAF